MCTFIRHIFSGEMGIGMKKNDENLFKIGEIAKIL